MGVYRKYNGKSGYDAVSHTATGYKCRARIFNPEDIDKEIDFFAKHIVGSDGRPYIEFGFESKEYFNHVDLMDRVKEGLSSSGFNEIFSILECDLQDLVFAEHASPIPNVISIRANAGDEGMVKIFESLGDFISDECIDFIRDQEEDKEENLYFSIIDIMGKELSKGPGGHEMAEKKARELANMFINGYSQN